MPFDLTTVDWIAVGIIAFAALGGFRQGLVVSVLSLAGLLAGAYVGSRVAPSLLSGGSTSQWSPLIALTGAILGAALFQALARMVGSFVRGGLRLTPFRFLDSFGGLAVGALTGLAFVWVLGAVALLLPGQQELRSAVRESTIVRRLNEEVPPRRLLNLLARIDPLFPSIAGPPAPSAPPTAAIARDVDVVAATASVVKVVGTACGIGVEGSGWFARPDLVVTNAHVVAGEDDTAVFVPMNGVHDVDVVAFDARNDIAVLRVHDVSAHPLPMVDPRDGTPVAILGYPENGPLTATPGRIGSTQTVLTEDAYGRGPVSRLITAVAGSVRHGNSGGPAVDETGAMQATIFAARIGAPSGYGVPPSVVERALDSAGRAPVSTGACADG
jgi:S1-C subfamily serine protease